MAWTTPRVWASGDQLTASLLNLQIRDNQLDLYGDSAWTAVTFSNSWVNFAGGHQNAKYKKQGETVFVRGLIKSGTINTAAFTLPTGYRPPRRLVYTSISNAAINRVDVLANGQVIAVSGNNAWVSLAGIRFSII